MRIATRLEGRIGTVMVSRVEDGVEVPLGRAWKDDPKGWLYRLPEMVPARYSASEDMQTAIIALAKWYDETR